MPTILDRLNHELESLGRRAQAALDEGKLQIELMRIRRQRENAARDLGFLVHRKERLGAVEQTRIDAQLLKLDDLDAEIASLERQLATVRAETTTVSDTPAPVHAQPAPAEEVPIDPTSPGQPW